MTSGAKPGTLRDLIGGPGLIVQGVVFDALSAYIAADAGFRTVLLGGYALGARIMVPDPLMSVDDVALATRQIARAVKVPLTADAAAGWGNEAHTANAVGILEQAGASGIMLEDQIFPRSLVDDQVHGIIAVEDMERKIRAARRVCRSTETVLIIRCGAMAAGGYEEVLRRARRYQSAGADVVQIYPPPPAELAPRAPKDLAGIPLSYVNSEANAYGLPVWPATDLEKWGWKLLVFGPGALVAATAASRDVYAHAATTGMSGLDTETMQEQRRVVNDAIQSHPGYAIARQR